MSGVNQFQTFAEGGGANALTPSAYAALTTLIANGYQTGVASSQQINTTLRQAAYASAVLAGIISDAGFDALDDGDLTTFKANLLKSMSIPAGAMMDFAGSSAPSGFLLCNGAAISRTAYAKLFAVIGTTFGAGDGSTTFNIPDARNRTRVGSGGLYAIGGSGGNKDSILPNHNHTLNLSDPGHRHLSGSYRIYDAYEGGDAAYGSVDAGWKDYPLSRYTYGGPTTRLDYVSTSGTGITASNSATGQDPTNGNMMPYFACPLIIKY